MNMNTETPALAGMVAMMRAARERYDELPDAGVIAIADAVAQNRRELGIDGAIRDVANTIGEDWRVVLACFRTVHPGRIRNAIAQDADGAPRRELETEDRAYRLEEEFNGAAARLDPCRVCGEELTVGGRTCKRCKRSIEYDRLERESGR